MSGPLPPNGNPGIVPPWLRAPVVILPMPSPPTMKGKP